MVRYGCGEGNVCWNPCLSSLHPTQHQPNRHHQHENLFSSKFKHFMNCASTYHQRKPSRTLPCGDGVSRVENPRTFDYDKAGLQVESGCFVRMMKAEMTPMEDQFVKGRLYCLEDMLEYSPAYLQHTSSGRLLYLTQQQSRTCGCEAPLIVITMLAHLQDVQGKLFEGEESRFLFALSEVLTPCWGLLWVYPVVISH